MLLGVEPQNRVQEIAAIVVVERANTKNVFFMSASVRRSAPTFRASRHINAELRRIVEKICPNLGRSNILTLCSRRDRAC